MYIITGGGTGIGKGLARHLANRGQKVLIVGRRELPLKDTASSSKLIDFLCADVSGKEGREAIKAKVQSADRLKGLIHNAGIIEPIVPINEISEHDWRRVMATNVEAPLFLTQLLYQQLIGGRVLNIGSGAAYFAVSGWSAYCVSKAALAMQTKCWQMESTELTFANVMPGIIDTDMLRLIRNTDNMDSEKKAFFQDLKQQNKLVSPDTVGLFLSWLLLDTDPEQFQSKEWDIYDKAHHQHWLASPYTVPTWE